MNWVSLLLAVIKAIGAVAAYLRERRIITDTEQRLISDALQKQAQVMEAADEAREAQRRRNHSVGPAGSLPDDGFRRD